MTDHNRLLCASLMLINSLLSAASDGDEFNEFMSDLDKLNVRKDVQVSQTDSLDHIRALVTPLIPIWSP